MNEDKIYAEKIIEEYSKKEDDKVKAIKKLDMKAKLPAFITTYTFGLFSALYFGVGICIMLGNTSNDSFIAGLIVEIIGLAMCGINLPIFYKKLNEGKARYGRDILALAKQIEE